MGLFDDIPTDGQGIECLVEMALALSKGNPNLVSFTLDGVRVQVRGDSVSEFLVKCFEYSRDSDTPFTVGRKTGRAARSLYLSKFLLVISLIWMRVQTDEPKRAKSDQSL
jgi:hypothetical protein